MKRNRLIVSLGAALLLIAYGPPARADVLVLAESGVRSTDIMASRTNWIWPCPTGNAGQSVQTFAVGNGNSGALVVCSSNDVAVTYCLSADSGMLKWQVSGSPAGGHMDSFVLNRMYTDPIQFPAGPPNVGGSAASDILISRRNASGTGPSHVLCLDGETGQTIWDYATPQGDYWASGFIPDVNGDGVYDVIVRSEYLGGGGGGLICLSGRDGATVLWHNTQVSRGGVAVPDVTGDGIPDYAVGQCCYDDRVLMLNAATGDIVWQQAFGAFDVLGILPVPGSSDILVAAQGSYGAGGVRRYRGTDGHLVWACNSEYNNQTLLGLVPTPSGHYVLSGWRHQSRVVCLDLQTGNAVWDAVPSANSDNAGITVPDQDGDGCGDLLVNNAGAVTLYSGASGGALRVVQGMEGAVGLAWVKASARPEGVLLFSTDQNQLVVWNMMTGESNTVPNIPAASTGVASQPSWFSNGDDILFTAGPAFHARVALVKPDGSDLRFLTDGSQDIVWPYAPTNGCWIVCHPVYGYVRLLNPDGSLRTNLPFRLSHTRASRDCRYIIGSNWAVPTYQSDEFLYDLRTGVLTNLTAWFRPSTVAFRHADISPDNTRIVFSGNGDIWTTTIDGGNPVNLTTDWPLGCDTPTWTPDGKFILFLCESQVWAMRPDGSGKVQLTLGPGAKNGPADLLMLPPSFTVRPASRTASPGETVILSANVAGSGPFTFQWQVNGIDIAGATNASLILRNLSAVNAGAYRVVVHGFGTVVSEPFNVSVLELCMLPGLKLSGPVGLKYRIEFTTELDNPAGWTELETVTLPATSYWYADKSAVGQPRRFYRAIPLD